MPRDNEKQRVFTRRAVVLAGLQAAGFSVLAGRLGYLQLMKDEKYTSLAENNRIKLQLVAPERGKLLDWRGEVLASNAKNYQLTMDMSGFRRDAFNAVVARLHALVTLPEKTRERLETLRLRSAMRPEMLKENLTWEEVAKIELHASELPGVYINLGQVRHYLLGEEAAHLTGYVGAVSEDDLSADDQPLMRLPDFKIGKNGVEHMLESRLRGTAGVKRLEVDVHGIPVREIDKRDPIPGESIRLTIDKRLQSFASGLIKDQAAAVVVMEIDTGNILTMASMPAFNPDIFSLGIKSDYWRELNENKKVPLMNKAIAGQYPPGSTFKMMVGIAALEKGVITSSTQVHCPGHFDLGNHRFNCWKEGGHGAVNYKRAITESCDTFFYTIAGRMGIQAFADMARNFGLGDTFDLGLIGERAGIIPDPEWKKKRYKQAWTGGDTINCAIGQGYMLSTPLQLCVMTARIAGGGFMVTPRLEKGPVNFDPLPVSEETLRLTMEAMSDVVNMPVGTAYGKRILDPAFAFAGKTGTSQVRQITVRGQDQNSIPWEHRHHALFVGYAPVDKPKYAVAVIVEHGGGGSAAAAPIARDVLQKVQELNS
ncbi:MAG: penicillin-binding protein 2 [Alphaproteobacteria bacterium]|nr:penicillin-binding protein 2 [Alphaproteobacteria bacterium]